MNRKIIVTGAGGFVGRHVCAELARGSDTTVVALEHREQDDLLEALQGADAVVHLAGVNRPADPVDFDRVNVGLTDAICKQLAADGAGAVIVFASSSQAGNGTPYGNSKLAAEQVIERYCQRGGAAAIFRFANIFGKWCRPRYNSVVATFADAIARDEPIDVHDPERQINLLHVADAVGSIRATLEAPPAPGRCEFRTSGPTREIRLKDLAELLESFRHEREHLTVTDLSDPFVRALRSTFLSYYPADRFAYDLGVRADPRGELAEFIKSRAAGQIFVSRTRPGITRGNHWHEWKIEKFLVLAGDAEIRFRAIAGGDVIVYRVRGQDFRVVDIPPGYTHSITNVGDADLVTLFWADEIFDATRPDTYAESVLRTGA